MNKVMNILPCGFLITSEEGKITCINKYLLELLALRQEEVIDQKRIHDFFPVGTKVYFETHVNPLLHMQGMVEEISMELIRSDKIRIPIILHGIVEKSSKNEPASFYYTIFDTSQRKKQEHELLLAAKKEKELSLQLQVVNTQVQKDNAYYKSLVENKSFFIIKVDSKNNFTYLNPAYCKKMQVEADDLLGKSALTSVLPEDNLLYIEAVKASLANPGETNWVTLRMLSPEGILSFHWEYCLLIDEELNTSELLFIGHDITPLIEKQQELQTTKDLTALQNNKLTNLAYIISHNVRSHVANLSGIISVTDMDDEENRTWAFDMLNKSVNALDETIRHINTVMAIRDNTDLPTQSLAVRDEINKILQVIQLSILTSNASVHCNIPPEELLTTNPAYFESVLLNLLTNAIKYRSSDRSPVIDISIAKEDEYTIIKVQDNGLGIDLAKHQDQLFGMYKTFHGNKDAKGLGLFISSTQMEAMRGKIEVDSEVGTGTTFKVYFRTNILP